MLHVIVVAIFISFVMVMLVVRGEVARQFGQVTQFFRLINLKNQISKEISKSNDLTFAQHDEIFGLASPRVRLLLFYSNYKFMG